MSIESPNIIYILSDEHRGQAMSHMGDPNIKTPNMDMMANNGVSFNRAYSNCPICTPSRGTIFSGRFAHSGPVAGFFDAYKATAPSTATLLKNEGYHTAYFGKWHCGIVRDQLSEETRAHPESFKGAASRTPEYHRAGFQDWYGFEVNNNPFESYCYCNKDKSPTKLEGYQTDAFTDLAIKYIKNYNCEKPLFMVLSVEPPHFPLKVPDEWKRFSPEELIVSPNFDKNHQKYREYLATYYAMIENLDWNIGRILNLLKKIDKFKNTLIVYLSDHGDFMGSHGRFARKEYPQEESVRIPSIFYWPDKIVAAGVIDYLYSTVDLLPTTLGLIGANIPNYIQGKDYSPGILGQEFIGHNEILLEMVQNPRWTLDFLDWRGFVDKKWKYAFYENGKEEMFDLEKDPFELDNMAYKSIDKCLEMRSRLLDLLKETREPFFDVLIEHGVSCETNIDVSSVHQLYPGCASE